MPFQKGKSGNPGGRPKELKNIQELARKSAPDAIRALEHVAKSGKSESARVAAAIALLDRGFGRPQQTVDMNLRRISADKIADDELAAIAAGGSDGAAEAEVDPARLN